MEKNSPNEGDSGIISRDHEDQERILRLLTEAEETGSKEKETLAYVEAVKYRLRRFYGIDKLSNIEAVHLRNIVEELLLRRKNEEELVRQKKENPSWLLNIESEATVLWLIELYGIRPEGIPYTREIKDLTTGEIFKYEEFEEKEISQKQEELKSEKHDFSDYQVISDEFKEYLGKMREKAHLI